MFVISGNSLASGHCSWEVEETTRAAKRLVPVIFQQVANESVPQPLRRLNYVFFSQGHSFSRGLSDLARALRADANWIREHTRYSELALRWAERSRPDALLLRGTDLSDASRWVAEHPDDAPPISAAQQEFVRASELAADAELAAKARLRWRVQIGLAAISLILAGLTIFSFYQWGSADRANELLEKTNSRLERKLALRAAPLGDQPYDVPAGWFQVATRYAGAVGFIESANSPGKTSASGVIVNAGRLNAKWGNRPMLLTATSIISRRDSQFPSQLRAEDAIIVFLGPKNERSTMRIGEVIWQSEHLGVSVSTIVGTLPIGNAMLDDEMVDDLRALGKVPMLPREMLGVPESGALITANPAYARPIVFVGNIEGRHEMTLSVIPGNQLIDSCCAAAIPVWGGL